MIDANNGYILNIAKRVLAETAEKEAFHEDPELYQELHRWIAESLSVLIADGEGSSTAGLGA